MELRQLRSFVVVADELHFRRAAERLRMAQPSVSQQIRRLEAELGVRLFDRSRRGATLTPAGAALLVEARELLSRADEAVAVTRATASGHRGRLRLSLTRSLTGGVAGAIVDAYRARYPEVDLDLTLGTTMLHVEQLLSGDIDVAFVRPPLEVPALEELPLGREPMVCVLPSGPRARPAHDRPGPRPPWRAARLVAREPWPRRLARGPPRGVRRPAVAADRPHGARGGADRRRRSPRARGSRSSCSAARGACACRARSTGASRRPEPSMGIAIAWRRGDDLPTLTRLRELAAEIAAA